MLYGFSHISKTGGTTLLNILRSSFGARHCDIEPWQSKHHSFDFTEKDLSKLLKIYPTLCSVNGHHFRPYNNYEEITPVKYFAFVRDPLSRCLSEYQYQTIQKSKSWSLNDYAHNTGSNAQSKFLCGEENGEAAIEIIQRKNITCGLTEAFDESLLLINRLVFDNKLNCFYSRQKSAPNQAVRDSIYSNEEALQLIRKNNEQDFKLYDFIKNTLYPEQVKQYGATLQSDLEQFKLALNTKGFNHLNIYTNRAYRNLVYKPSLACYRLFNQSS